MKAARTLVVATRNEHKLAELRVALPGVVLEPLAEGIELPPESGDTFAANALAKARAAHRATGLAAIADDSGIEVAALGGRPGVRSARFAGPSASDAENLARLIEEMTDIDERRAAYVCVIAHVDSRGEDSLFEGRCAGRLAAEPRGSGGFGYDPLFLPDEAGGERTMAELTPAEKDEISHRGRAARALAAHLAAATGVGRG